MPNVLQGWFRNAFASRVLGTTAAVAPQRLSGGLSLGARIALSMAATAIAWLAAWSIGPIGVLFLFPALMVAGVGGVWLGIATLALDIVGVGFLFPVIDIWTFGTAAVLQTGLGLLGRALFQESRRWGVRYRRLLNATADAVTVSNGKGEIEWEQPELSHLIGLPWPDYAGARWMTTVHPDDRALLTPPEHVTGATVQRAEIRLRDPASLTWRWHLMRAVPMLNARSEAEEWVSILTDIHDRKLVQDQRDMQIGEARHRLKNLITIIDSIAKSSRPREVPDAGVEAFLKKFLGRLHALSAAGDLALASNYTVVDMQELTTGALAPFQDSARIKFAGPKLTLSEATGGAVALGIHELVTNAIKYGSLSVPEGTVAFTWRLDSGVDQDRVLIEWEESGGPPPKLPEKDGYGARLIRFIASRERDGKVETSFEPKGFICRISFSRPKAQAETDH